MQVYLVVVTAVVMGFTFGLIFGLLDVEDEKLSHLRVALLREERYTQQSRHRSACLAFIYSICYPLGALFGGIAAATNQWMREESDQYRFDPILDDELDDDY
mgnify:CR=1 FL=1